MLIIPVSGNILTRRYKRMEVTDIKIRLVSPTDQLRAFATVVFDSVLVVHNIKIVSTGDKLIIAMPSRQVHNGEYKDIVHPITSDFRSQLSDKVLRAYRDELAREGR